MKVRFTRKRQGLLLFLPFLAAAYLLWSPQVALAAPTPVPVPIPQDCAEANIFYGAVPPGGENAPVLVFVHGYGGQAIDWWFFNFGSGFNDMYDLAYSAGYRTAFVTDNLTGEAANCEVLRRPVISVFDAGDVLKRQLEYITDHYDVDQVSIVAHSKGGVDSQVAIVFNGAASMVNNLFTLSSPHQGEILADLVWSASDIPGLGDLLDFFGKDEGLRTLRVNNMEVYRLYADEQAVNEQISYYSAGGTGWQGSGGITEIGGFILQLLGYDNDGVVTVDSTYLPYALPFFVADYNHNEMYQGSNVFHYIQDVLTAAPLTTALSGPATGAVNTTYTFTAVPEPITLTVPLTYTWEATGHPPVTVAGERENMVAFSWTSAGDKTVQVTVSNQYGSAAESMTINIQAAAPNTGPASVIITGEDRPVVGASTSFTADVAPINSTQPLQYTWSATNQGSVVHTNGVNDTVSFTWSSTGLKTVSVSVTNGVSTVGASFNVNVGRAPTTLELLGPAEGSIDANYNFTAVANSNVSSPVTYTWRSVDHDEVQHVSGSSDTLTLNWPESGLQPIAVKAENAWGSTVAFVTININTPPLTVTVSGEAIGVINTTHFFTATSEPPEVTVPLTYTWQSSGSPAQLVQMNGTTDIAGFTWGSAGNQSVSVTAANVGGSANDSATINIINDEPGTAPTALLLSGPTHGLINTTYQFVAAVTPQTATQPVHYTWQVNGQTVREQDSGGNDVVTFTWPDGGIYEISVTATNAFGAVSDDLSISVISPVTSVSANWPAVLPLNVTYDFTAAVQPLTATTPVTYTWWTPDLFDEVIHVGGLTDTFSYAFTSTGAKAIAVTVNNGAQDIQASTTIEVIRPITSVGLTGPDSGVAGQDYTFTAAVLPANATTPVDYTWEATGQTPVVHSGDITDDVTFNWVDAGSKTVTVTASNGLDSYSASVTIEIADAVTPPANVTLSGPTSGLVNTPYTFTANVTPADTTTPVTYTWEATGQPVTVHSGGLSDAITWSWAGQGNKTITVTAGNAGGSVSDVFTISIGLPVTPPSAASINGPASGVVNTPYQFTVDVTPPSTTTPLTYTWEATGQTPIVHSGDLNDAVTFTWSTPGVKTVVVTAANAAASVSDTLTIDVTSAVIAPTSVSLSGPDHGMGDTSYTFTAQVSPANATTPLTYEWSATDQTDVVHTSGLSDAVSFSWSSAGIKTVWLTVSNGAGSVTQSTAIHIEVTYHIFLPFAAGSSALQNVPTAGGNLSRSSGKASFGGKPFAAKPTLLTLPIPPGAINYQAQAASAGKPG